MRNVVRFTLAAVVCALVVLPVAGQGRTAAFVDASATSGNPVLTAHVEDDYTIELRDPDGINLDQRTLPAGTYTVEVDDNSTFHNFHLLGPAVVSCEPTPPPPALPCQTDIANTGHETWTVTFQPEAATYQCDPHVGIMEGQDRKSVV